MVEFADRVRDRDLVVGVVGLGYVGLPLAVAYAEAGFRTIGFDVDTERAAALSDGRSHIDDVSSDRVTAMVTAGRFGATADASGLSAADVLFLCVPTPFDKTKTPDLSFVRAATHTVAQVLRPGMLVILQSTTYPGTTVEIVQPVLEERGLRAGADFHLAFSPERVDPGNPIWTVHNTPKVVGGFTPTCADRARAVLDAVMDDPGLVRVVSTPATAEMAKLLENTYRAVNIALVNELAILADEMGIDIWEVIDAAATKPFGFQAFQPGIGPGGHCIPVDPYYLSWKAREFDFQTKFIELAADTNLSMAQYVVHRIHRFTNRLDLAVRGLRVLCLGAAFKPGVSDVRNSRAIRVMELLDEQGARVEYSDPMVPSITLPSGEHKAVGLTDFSMTDFDVVVVLVANTDWPVDALRETDVPVFDAVNAIGRPARDRHERL
jgi:UDP-N-acetyl-D-glucosamine dehydrogenase